MRTDAFYDFQLKYGNIIPDIREVYVKSKNTIPKDNKKLLDRSGWSLNSYFDCSGRELLFIVVIVAIQIEKGKVCFHDLMLHFIIDIFQLLEYLEALNKLKQKHYILFELNAYMTKSTVIIVNNMIMDALIHTQAIPNDFELFKNLQKQNYEYLFMESNPQSHCQQTTERAISRCHYTQPNRKTEH